MANTKLKKIIVDLFRKIFLQINSLKQTALRNSTFGMLHSFVW